MGLWSPADAADGLPRRTGPIQARAIDWLAKPVMAFLLNYDSSRANLAVVDKIADLDLDDVAPAQLAVDREIEHRTVA